MTPCPRADKIAHPHQRAANVALLNLWLKVDDIEERLKLNAYECMCGKFHVGRKKGADYERVEGE